MIKRYARGLALLAVSLVALLMMTMTIPVITTYDRIDLDFSWEMDLAHKWRHGEISGRDFYFTYGPGAQILYSASALLRPGASIIERAPLTYFLLRLAVVATLVACVYAVPRLDWRTAALTVAVFALLISAPIYLRALLAIVAVLVMARCIHLPAGRRRDILFALSGLAAFGGQLMTFEVGLFAVLACGGTLAVCGALWLLRRRLPADVPPLTLLECLQAMALVVGTYAAANIALSLLFKLTGPSDYRLFDYQRYNLQIARAYNYTMGAQWDLDPLMLLLLLALAVNCLWVVARHFPLLPVERRYIYLALIVLSIVHFKGAVIRSGGIKILMSIAPLLFLFLLLLFDPVVRRRVSAVGVLLLLLLMAAWPLRTGIESLRLLTTALATPQALPNHLRSLASLQLAPSAVVPDALNGTLDPDSYILNFPYENLMAVALDRPSVTPFLQPYLANSNQLQERYVQRMAPLRERTEIVYSLDGITSNELDVLQNVTRSPVLFDYIYSNFELKRDELINGGYFVLHPRAAPVQLRATPLSFQQTSGNGGLRATLAAPASCTLLKLHLQIDYPPTALLGRPTPLAVRALSGQKELVGRNLVPLAIGEEFTTYLYLSDPRTFYRVFAPGRPVADTEVVDTLELGNVSFGMFDVAPSRFQLNGIDCIDLGPGQIVAAQPARDAAVAPISADASVRQEFVAEQDQLAGVYLEFATFARRNSGPLQLQLQRIGPDGAGTVVAEQTFDMASIADNSRVLFAFTPQPSASQRYALVVAASTGTPTNAVTLWMQTGDPYTQGRLWQGVNEVGGDLSFRLLYAQP